MPIYWVAASGAVKAGNAISTQSQQLIAAGLAAAGWVVAGVSAWWFGDNQPSQPPGITLQSCDGSDFMRLPGDPTVYQPEMRQAGSDQPAAAGTGPAKPTLAQQAIVVLAADMHLPPEAFPDHVAKEYGKLVDQAEKDQDKGQGKDKGQR